MQALPGTNGGHWRISPVIPGIANGVLAALWVFSAFGGWGEEAFCGEGGGACSDDFAVVAAISAIPAAAAVAIIAVALLPRNRRALDRVDLMLTLAAVVWVLAEGIVFVGGWFAK